MSDQPLLKTAGELLGEARVAQGLSLEVLAERTKIPVKVLSALEMDEYHKISGPLYIKSFLRTCATDLGLDAEHILDLYSRFGGEKGGPAGENMVWEEEEVRVSQVGLPWPKILGGAGLLVVLVGLTLFGLRGCGGDSGSPDPGDQTRSVLEEETTPADARRGSLLASNDDSLAPGDDAGSEEVAEVDAAQGAAQGSVQDAVPEEGAEEKIETPVTPAATVEEKVEEAPATTEPEERVEEKKQTTQETSSQPAATVSRQEEPPPRPANPGTLPPAVAGNAGTPFADGRAWPVVMRLITDLPLQVEVRRDGESEFQTAAWTEPVALPMRGIRPGRAYGVREGLVVYWGATDHFDLRLDRVVGVRVSINGVDRDISSLRPGEEIVLDDHSAASADRR